MEIHFCTGGFTNPILLHFLCGFWPVNLFKIFEKFFCIGSDLQYPLSHVSSNNRIAVFTLTISHFFICQNCLFCRAPVHWHFSYIGKSLIVEL